MMHAPDAPSGDVEAGADSGHDASGCNDPQNPIGAMADDEAVDAEVPTRVVAQETDDRETGGGEAPGDAFPAPGDGEAPGDAFPAPGDGEAPGDAFPAPSEKAADQTDDVAGRDDLAPQPPAAAPAEAPAVRELRAQVAELTSSLAGAQRRADELATVARKQTEMADELHADNRRLRNGEIREAVAPLVRGLARLADDLSRMRATAAATPEDLAYLDGQVSELLHDAGVLTVPAEVGEPFDPQRHQATGSATTAVVALDRTIAEVRRMGFRRDDGRMLRPVDVVVFRYVAPAPPAAQSATEEVT